MYRSVTWSLLLLLFPLSAPVFGAAVPVGNYRLLEVRCGDDVVASSDGNAVVLKLEGARAESVITDSNACRITSHASVSLVSQNELAFRETGLSCDPQGCDEVCDGLEESAAPERFRFSRTGQGLVLTREVNEGDQACAAGEVLSLVFEAVQPT